MIDCLTIFALALLSFSGDGHIPYGNDIDMQFSKDIFFAGEATRILDTVKEINIHIIPSRGFDNVDRYDEFSERTKLATLTGTDATDFLAAAMNEAYSSRHDESDSCHRDNVEIVAYHVLVSRKDSEEVGYFIARRCLTKHHFVEIKSFYADGDPGIRTYSHELFKFLPTFPFLSPYSDK